MKQSTESFLAGAGLAFLWCVGGAALLWAVGNLIEAIMQVLQ